VHSQLDEIVFDITKDLSWSIASNQIRSIAHPENGYTVLRFEFRLDRKAFSSKPRDDLSED
jgi:hypothetical protein